MPLKEGSSQKQAEAIAYNKAEDNISPVIKATGIMYVAQNNVLLLKRFSGDFAGTWAFPGGVVEENESILQAARRESLEEVGFEPPADSNIMLLNYSHNDNIEFITYLCILPERFTPVLNDEHDGYMWTLLDTLPQNLHPGIPDVINKYQNMMLVGMDSVREYDTNGWFEIKNNPLSKEGVFPYLGASIGAPEPNRIYNVYRPASELSDPETLKSFRLIPLINDHVMLGSESKGLTPAEQKGIEGIVGEDIKFNNGILYANIKILSENLVKVIESGKKQLSAAYRCVYDFTSGVWNGIKYDAIQRNIRGNHTAVVQEGRMGAEVCVLDQLKFTFDEKELATMAEENKESEKKSMTLEEAIAMLEDLTPKVAKLMEIMQGKSDESTATVDEDDKEKDDEKKKDEKSGMDAAMEKLTAEVKELRENGVKSTMKMIADKTMLADQLSKHIGTFDHADKTLDEVAVYGANKLGLECEKGHELTAVKTYLKIKPVNDASFALDKKEVKKSSALDAYINAA